MCSKDIPGFGELFRYLTYLRHGTAALATRATACAVGDRLVFAVPGSPEAVETALTKLILPEVRHLIAELRGLRH
jgi:molybdenum cofactor biosynthesis protein B